jgi:hypothetical protein
MTAPPCAVEKIAIAFFGHECVAQVGNLLYRRLPVCRVRLNPAANETKDFYKAVPLQNAPVSGARGVS